MRRSSARSWPAASSRCAASLRTSWGTRCVRTGMIHSESCQCTVRYILSPVKLFAGGNVVLIRSVRVWMRFWTTLSMNAGGVGAQAAVQVKHVYTHTHTHTHTHHLISSARFAGRGGAGQLLSACVLIGQHTDAPAPPHPQFLPFVPLTFPSSPSHKKTHQRPHRGLAQRPRMNSTLTRQPYHTCANIRCRWRRCWSATASWTRPASW